MTQCIIKDGRRQPILLLRLLIDDSLISIHVAMFSIIFIQLHVTIIIIIIITGIYNLLCADYGYSV